MRLRGDAHQDKGGRASGFDIYGLTSRGRGGCCGDGRARRICAIGIQEIGGREDFFIHADNALIHRS